MLWYLARMPGGTLVRAMDEALQTDTIPAVSQHTLPFETFTAANI